jgi:hypothetical protein
MLVGRSAELDGLSCHVPASAAWAKDALVVTTNSVSCLTTIWGVITVNQCGHMVVLILVTAMIVACEPPLRRAAEYRECCLHLLPPIHQVISAGPLSSAFIRLRPGTAIGCAWHEYGGVIPPARVYSLPLEGSATVPCCRGCLSALSPARPTGHLGPQVMNQCNP